MSDFGPYGDLVFFLGGLTALIVGGQFLVRGAIGLGQFLNLSPLFTGLIIVAMGSSAPELVVAMSALNAGQPDLAVGNVIGSNITNGLLILGLAAVIEPLAIRRSMVVRDAFAMLLATATIVWIAQNSDQFTRFHGTLLVGMLVIFVLMSFVMEQVTETDTGDRIRALATSHRLPIVAAIPLDVLLLIGGTVLLYFGSFYMIKGAAGFAMRLGVSEAVVGLSIVAIGTSLPELATTLMAAMQRRSEIVVGNILGSNIFNILAVIGITSFMQPVDIASRFAHTDMWIMLASSIVLVPFMVSNWRLSRAEGIVLVLFYFIYIGALYTGFGVR